MYLEPLFKWFQEQECFFIEIVTTDPLEKANKYKTILDSFFMGKRTIPPPQSKFVTEHPEPCR